jgi:hypothetical protein
MVIKYSKLPMRGICLFVVILVRDNSKHLLNHEKIHFRQQLEMLVIPFFLMYILEYLFYLMIYRDHDKAYRTISFEREAYANQYDLDYLKKRPFWAFTNY